MTAAENSLLGFAKQALKGTPIADDAAFDYILYTEAALGPNNVVVPLDPEVGGGALPRDLKKMGVYSGGGFEFIPRPETLGHFLAGITNTPASEELPLATGAYKHTFTLDDPFVSPYYTVRLAPGGLWGEELLDCRISALNLEWRAPGFVRATAAVQGGMPAKIVTPTAGPGGSQVDGSAPFITPISTITLNGVANLKVQSGAFTAAAVIPLDEQWKVGAYAPDAQDITSRAYSLTLNVKIDDASLYSKMLYDPAGGEAWVAKLFREGNFEVKLATDVLVGTGTPSEQYLAIRANGQSGEAANVVWSARQIGTRAGRQLMLSVTGLFLATSHANGPITLELVNTTPSY
ncbi:MAG TPA: phage tail tube protein [Anaerolineaceae bacterium]|nr:phage tail tube protein [Anaerolineaceae bacterium]